MHIPCQTRLTNDCNTSDRCTLKVQCIWRTVNRAELDISYANTFYSLGSCSKFFCDHIKTFQFMKPFLYMPWTNLLYNAWWHTLIHHSIQRQFHCYYSLKPTAKHQQITASYLIFLTFVFSYTSRDNEIICTFVNDTKSETLTLISNWLARMKTVQTQHGINNASENQCLSAHISFFLSSTNIS